MALVVKALVLLMVEKGVLDVAAMNKQYKDNFDKIDWGKNKDKPKFRVKINGVDTRDDE